MTLTPSRMAQIWNSYMRMLVEERHPDQYSLGRLLNALQHYEERPQDFADSVLDQVKAHVREHHPRAWTDYQKLIKT
jgi:hypothetical protein